MCRSAVVKLGGSVVTVKDKPYTLDRGAIRRIAGILSSYVAGGGRLALVHGGGSFGHTAVREVLARRGHMGVEDLPHIQLAMLKLSMAIVEELYLAGVGVVLHPTHTLCGESCSLAPVIRDYRLGLTPVVYGDAVDGGGGVRIISGDDLALLLAESLRPDCTLYVTRVPGVLDPGGGVIPVLRSVEDFRPVDDVRDATGGMYRK
ncbi:MAG: hypothetical protein GSR86_00185, partial [Desulfurococcales archaeon]|nr:hypothetical protein [Desulfurococcales archaeon]